MTRALWGLAVLGGLIAAGPVAAQDDRAAPFRVDGYAMSLAGWVRGPDAGTGSETAGLGAQLVRVRWTAPLGEATAFEIEQRIQATLTTASLGDGLAGGVGVSSVPGRSLDLSWTVVDRERLRVRHDIDRLTLTHHGSADVTLGRQPITWGVSALFPVADLWSRFSPLELDTEQKPGIDALRVLAYPAEGLELDAIVADRGTLDELSAGVRATWELQDADVYGGAGKFWREAMVMGGVTWLLSDLRLRGEATLPYDLRRDSLALPRATVGADWLGGDIGVTMELHFNGVGADAATKYGQVLQDGALERGESYLLGRRYLGLAVQRTAAETTWSVTSLVNVGDGSALLAPSVSHTLPSGLLLSAGALLGFGEPPVVGADPTRTAFGSEFGAYGDLWFARASVYF